VLAVRRLGEADNMLKAPFPYFGGKSSVAPYVWSRLGGVPNYVEPFFGSGVMLLMRPGDHQFGTETVNDADGLLANFWRAVQLDPDAVAHHADWPVSECDLHARHAWLVGERENVTCRLEGDPEWFDARAAGWWVWGICAWIGGGWCSGKGPWAVVDGELLRTGDGTQKRQIPAIGNAGQGINRGLPHLGDAGQGINRSLSGAHGWDGQCREWSEHLREMMGALSDRLRRVRVCCGDWSRVCGSTPTTKQGLTGVFLAPPYDTAERYGGCYALDKPGVSGDVRRWAIEHGNDPMMRIALCGYDTEHDMPETWDAVPWKTPGGYGNQGEGRGRRNKAREMMWFSPHCLAAKGDECHLTFEEV
jgi:DNA adenine methylase